MSQSVSIVSCPACGAKIPYSLDNPWRPFCSQRCKQVDFGAWASESFRVAGKVEDLEPDELLDLSMQDTPRH